MREIVVDNFADPFSISKEAYGLQLKCYRDGEHCADRDPTGWCGRFDRMCEEVNMNEIVEDGEDHENDVL